MEEQKNVNQINTIKENLPELGQETSIWVKGKVIAVAQNKAYKGGVVVEILNEKTRAHCFVPLSALEPTEGGDENEPASGTN